jgi:hypothetical protein
MNNHRAQSGKADGAKPCRIAFALFHRFTYPLRDDLTDTVRTARSAEPSTCQVERLIHYPGVAVVKGVFKLMYRCHRRSLNHVVREGASKELPRGMINAPNFMDFPAKGVLSLSVFLRAYLPVFAARESPTAASPRSTADISSGVPLVRTVLASFTVARETFKSSAASDVVIWPSVFS